MYQHSRWSVYIVGLVAILVYVNTLVGGFTFDDNFAVINNGDVTSDSNPLSDLFKHDFWGQDIASPQSHKSYRPVTILVFRWTRHTWNWVVTLTPWLPQLLRTPGSLSQQDALSDKPARPAGVHPFPFHVLSITLHGVVSILVLALAQHLFARLEQITGNGMATRPADASSTAAAAAADVGRTSNFAAGSDWPISKGLQGVLLQNTGLWLVPVTPRGQLQALMAGLLFGLHPVHTEAVAGVVGCAEMICAALSLPALLLYFKAVDGRYAAASNSSQLATSQPAAAAAAAAQGPQGSNSRGSQKAAHSKLSSTGKAQQGQSSAPQAADAASSGLVAPTMATKQPFYTDGVQHWLLVAAAAGLAFLAALSKEIGITVVGTMVLYDLLLASHMVPTDLRLGGQAAGTAAACRRQLLRIAVLAVVGLAYVRLRQWVAVQQLVAIYRKVENPIPFVKSFWTRFMTIGYLHSRYFGLLVLPVHLSADWSFSCIPLVEQVSDTRNAAMVALYMYFLLIGLSCKPLRYLQQLWGSVQAAVVGNRQSCSIEPTATDSQLSKQDVLSNGTAAAHNTSTDAALQQVPASVAGLAHMRWRLMVLLGLLIAPFFPASNVLFYVGTFIGERLLYFPSIGFCILLADSLGTLLPLHWRLLARQQATGQQAATAAAAVAAEPEQPATAATDSSSSLHSMHHKGQQQLRRRNSTGREILLAVIMTAVLLGYGVRTVVRNIDWWNEERLFMAALRTCPNSAKVQQNCGVLMRRYQDHDKALSHFRRAQEIEPGYCEPSYWIALTMINQGDLLRGLVAMKASLSCKYTASEALQTLNKLYLMMHENAPRDPTPMVEWAGVLADPAVQRVADACSTAEDAALLAATVGKSHNFIEQTLDVCIRATRRWQKADIQPDTLAGLARAQYGGLNATLLGQCVKLRLPVYKQLCSHAPGSRAVRQALYKYISKVRSSYHDCRTLAGGGNAAGNGQQGAPSSHQKLLHRVQSADPEDPWLQLEWGQTLIALGPETNLANAAMHLEVASAIFSRLQHQLQPGHGAESSAHVSISKDVNTGITELDGKTRLTPTTALEAAMMSLEVFVTRAANNSQPSFHAGACETLKRLCHLRLQMLAITQQAVSASKVDAAAGVASHSKSLKAALNAKKAALTCLAELSGRPGCEPQALDVRQLMTASIARIK